MADAWALITLLLYGEWAAPCSSDKNVICSDPYSSGTIVINYEVPRKTTDCLYGTTPAIGFMGLGKLIISHVGP